MVKSHVEESLGANPGDAALNPADSVAMGVAASRVPRFIETSRGRPFRALQHPAYRLLFVAFLITALPLLLISWVLAGTIARVMGKALPEASQPAAIKPFRKQRPPR